MEPGTSALLAKANPEDSYQERRKGYCISPSLSLQGRPVQLPSLNFFTPSFLFAVHHCCHWCTWNQMHHIHLDVHFILDISTPSFLLPLLIYTLLSHPPLLLLPIQLTHSTLYFPMPFFCLPSYGILNANSNIFFLNCTYFRIPVLGTHMFYDHVHTKQKFLLGLWMPKTACSVYGSTLAWNILNDLILNTTT